jgi:hypothetical protein
VEEERYLDFQTLGPMHDRLGQAEQPIYDSDQRAANKRMRTESAVALAAASTVLSAAFFFISSFAQWFH